MGKGNTYFWEANKIQDIGMPIDNLATVTTTKKLLWGLWSKSHTDIYFTSNSALYSLDKVSPPPQSEAGL